MAHQHYVLEIAGQTCIGRTPCTNAEDQLQTARKLARMNGRAAVLSGEVLYFWADVDAQGRLEVGSFDEELCPDEDEV